MSLLDDIDGLAGGGPVGGVLRLGASLRGRLHDLRLELRLNLRLELRLNLRLQGVLVDLICHREEMRCGSSCDIN